jgi:hypothetical protein
MYRFKTKTEPGSPPNTAANALSVQLRSGISAMTQSISNVESGDNCVSTAAGGLAVTADLLNRGRELAIQPSNSNLNDSQRETLNQGFSQIQMKSTASLASSNSTVRTCGMVPWDKMPTRLIFRQAKNQGRKTR